MELGWEYFSGANVIVSIQDMPILECAGMRCSISESKRPIYGYSSRHFDAVANGQVLVEGALIINYVHQNYLMRAIEMGLDSTGALLSLTPPPAQSPDQELRNQMQDEIQSNLLAEEYLQDPINNGELAEAFKSRWNNNIVTSLAVPDITPNPHDVFGGLRIEATFGNRDNYNFGKGVTSYILDQVYFTGRGQQISIDGDVIVDTFPFFARNMYHIKQPYTLNVAKTDTPNGKDETISIENRGQ